MIPSKITRLSPEILKNILERGTEIEDKEDRVKFAHRVASVCRAWRGVGNDTPALWSTIYISLGRDEEFVSLKKTIERSQSRELDISITQGTCEDDQEPKLIADAMQILVAHIKRWHSVHVDVFSVDSVLAATKTWKESADVLEEIFLGSSGEQLNEEDLVLFSLSPKFTAPKLRVYVLYDMYCTQDGKRLPQLFPALEELSMVRTAFQNVTTSGQLLKLLKPLRSLRSLNLCDPQSSEDDDEDDDDEEGEATPATGLTCLSALTELELQDMTSGELNGFFKALAAPNLRTLSLSKCNIDPDALPHLRHQLSRFRSLDTVRLYMNDLKVAHISEFFSAFTHLHLILTPLDELFASLKARPRGEWWSFPRLTSIELHTTTGFPSNLLREIVEARRTASGAGAESGSPLAIESITVYSDASISEEDRSWFKDNLRAFVWSDTTSYKGADACTVKLVCAPPN